jgi:hypothetical protein
MRRPRQRGEQRGQRYKHYKVRDTPKDSPALKRRAMGRIEHTLLVGDGHPNRPKTFARTPLNPTIPQKVTNVSIYHKGAGYYVVLSRILQLDFGEFTFHALG